MNSPTSNELEKKLNKLFNQGGLQKYFPRDEARIYVNNLLLDSIKHCVKNFEHNEPSQEERNCVTNFMNKNYELLNSNSSL